MAQLRQTQEKLKTSVKKRMYEIWYLNHMSLLELKKSQKIFMAFCGFLLEYKTLHRYQIKGKTIFENISIMLNVQKFLDSLFMAIHGVGFNA